MWNAPQREILNMSDRLCVSCRFTFLSRFTDICKDSSDDDYSDANSSHTEGYAVMDVIEYELPDDSESDDVSSASSGTDVSVHKDPLCVSQDFKGLFFCSLVII